MLRKGQMPEPRPFDVTHRSVLAIALPMTIAYLSTPLLGIVDTAVIGQLGRADLLGGIAVGAIVFDFLFTTFNFLRMGTTGQAAQAYGAETAGDAPAALKDAHAALKLSPGFAPAATLAARHRGIPVLLDGFIATSAVVPLHAAEAAALSRNGALISVAGGGDTVAALNKAGAAQDFTYISTAGGAFLEWMEGKALPGVAALDQS